MKLLLVDDEEYVIESIKQKIVPETLKIVEIYTAFSMKQAQHIMELVPIDMIISDIVMPQGSGFDFIQWVREQGYQTQVIFLTSYAEFDYAKRAIALESVDYLLKPIDYEKLREALKKAVERVDEVKRQQVYRRVNQHWQQNYSVICKDFWREILKGNIRENEFYSEVMQRHIPYEIEEDFLVIYLSFYEKSREIWDEKTLGFVIENVFAEMLEKTGCQIETVVPDEKNSYSIIVTKHKQEMDEEADCEELVFAQFISWLREKLLLDIWCGVGNWIKACQVQEMQILIKAMQDSSLSLYNKVLYLSDFKHPQNAYSNPNLNMWETLLREEKGEELLIQIMQYLDEMERREQTTRDNLKSFRLDINQLVYTWLAGQGIKAHALFSAKEDEGYYHNALSGIHGAKKYGENLIEKAVRHHQYINKTESVAEQIRQYIDLHFREEIRRDELGELVFLNTDYLSRIFKKETGMSISAYILQKRVTQARELLTKSSLPINTVSIYVGYSNFSYFTKMFKENTGFAPLEYRRKYSNILEKERGD